MPIDSPRDCSEGIRQYVAEGKGSPSEWEQMQNDAIAQNSKPVLTLKLPKLSDTSIFIYRNTRIASLWLEFETNNNLIKYFSKSPDQYERISVPTDLS